MKKILQIDGGGIRGIIPAVICAEVEEKTGKRICYMFDLITGTSTGSILGGALAAGVEAERIKKLYLEDGPRLFKKRNQCMPWNWFRARYNRKTLMGKLSEIIGDVKMSQLNTRYMAAAFNLCSRRTHFIKSWDKEDAALSLVDVISWSALSAAFYFGKICVPDYRWKLFKIGGMEDDMVGAVFQDGAQGINNCTLGYDLIECMANNWDDEGVFILSLGCGSRPISMNYEMASKTGFLGQIIDFVTQARKEATKSQVLQAKYIEKHRENFKCSRLDIELLKEQDKLDAVKHAEDFLNMGETMAVSVPYDSLLNT